MDFKVYILARIGLPPRTALHIKILTNSAFGVDIKRTLTILTYVVLPVGIIVVNNDIESTFEK